MITFSKVCRLCINKTHSDYTIQFVDEDSITLGDKIKIVCNIQINQSDCLPASICELCLDKIRQFYDFKLLCLHTSRQLSQLKKQFLISSSKTKKPQNISVQSIKDLSQNTNLIQNCITDQLKQVTSVQQQPSVQDESSQLVQSHPNDDHNAYTLPYDDRNVNIITSVPDNALKQVITKDPLVIDGETMKVESKTNKKLAHVKLEMNVKKVEDKWMNWENSQQSKAIESAQTVDSSVEDTNDHIANEEDTDAKDDEIDGLMEYDSYLCDICSKHFTNKFSFLRHQRYHVQHETNYQCDRCGKQFKLKASYQKHMLRYSGKRPYKCDICNKTFTDKVYLYTHSKTHSDARPYQCEICGKTFKYNSDHRVHLTTHSDEKPYKCPTCGKAFRLRTVWNVHVRTHSGLRPFKCSTCGKCFPDKRALKLHGITHTTERKYQCDICQMWFKRQGILKGHKRIHSRDPNEIKPCNFTCEICGKMVRTKDSLMKHAGVHSEERPFKCELCGKCFKYKSCCNAHRRIYHEGKTVECTVCGKSCTTKNVLARHMLLHTGEKPHKCELCGKCFADPSALRSHTIAHSNIKQHKCDYCAHEFKHKNHMMIHIKKKHSDLITKTNNISKESAANAEEQSESMMVDNEEETNRITMTENELIPEIIIEEQACEIIIAET